jgi:hypothetical protein
MVVDALIVFMLLLFLILLLDYEGEEEDLTKCTEGENTDDY